MCSEFLFVGAFLSGDNIYIIVYIIYTLYKEMIFLSGSGKFAELSREQLDKLNALQHEITDTSGNGVILVAYCKNCSGCSGCK